jgi:hypothetical protein
MIKNRKRAEAAVQAYIAAAAISGVYPLTDVLTDLLFDLRFYCEFEGIDFEHANGDAFERFEEGEEE